MWAIKQCNYSLFKAEEEAERGEELEED